MDAGDALAGHREQAERVVGAQVGFGGERKPAEVVERVQVVGMHAGGLEAAAVVGHVGVGVRRATSAAGELQAGDLVAGGAFDRLQLLRPRREVGQPVHGLHFPSPGRKELFAQHARGAAEFGHRDAVGGVHGDVVNPGAAGARPLRGGRHQLLAEPGRAQVGDAAVLRHGALVVAVAGEGEGGIGEREDEAAVADAVAVHHVLAHPHRSVAWPGPTASSVMPSAALARSSAHMAAAQARARAWASIMPSPGECRRPLFQEGAHALGEVGA